MDLTTSVISAIAQGGWESSSDAANTVHTKDHVQHLAVPIWHGKWNVPHAAFYVMGSSNCSGILLFQWSENKWPSSLLTLSLDLSWKPENSVIEAVFSCFD